MMDRACWRAIPRLREAVGDREKIANDLSLLT